MLVFTFTNTILALGFSSKTSIVKLDSGSIRSFIRRLISSMSACRFSTPIASKSSLPTPKNILSPTVLAKALIVLSQLFS